MKETLNQLSKEQLIYLIEQFVRSQGIISEICVDESKYHIKSDKAINEIRKYLYNMPDYHDIDMLKAEIDFKMGKISVLECRKKMGLE